MRVRLRQKMQNERTIPISTYNAQVVYNTTMCMCSYTPKSSVNECTVNMYKHKLYVLLCIYIYMSSTPYCMHTSRLSATCRHNATAIEITTASDCHHVPITLIATCVLRCSNAAPHARQHVYVRMKSDACETSSRYMRL